MATIAFKERDETKQEKIEDLVSHILEEARMVLPGIQALLGFQLVAVFNQSFSEMSRTSQLLHVAAIFLSVNAICLLLTPAAVHRQGNPEVLTREFARTASKLICAGMLPLLFSIVLDSYVVFNVVIKQPLISILLAAFLLAELVYFWLLLPQKKRRESANTMQTPSC